MVNCSSAAAIKPAFAANQQELFMAIRVGSRCHGDRFFQADILDIANDV